MVRTLVLTLRLNLPDCPRSVARNAYAACSFALPSSDAKSGILGYECVILVHFRRSISMTMAKTLVFRRTLSNLQLKFNI